MDGSGPKNKHLAEQEALKLKPGVCAEISQVKNGAFPREETASIKGPNHKELHAFEESLEYSE